MATPGASASAEPGPRAGDGGGDGGDRARAAARPDPRGADPEGPDPQGDLPTRELGEASPGGASPSTTSTMDLSPTLPQVAPLVELDDGYGHPRTRRGFGRYVIEGELGRGGMGVVLLAFDRDLRRHVAMKVLKRSLASRRRFIERFTAEAQVTAQLQHPVVVPVYELGATEQGELFYTMRLVHGRTLAEEIRASRDAERAEAAGGGGAAAAGAGDEGLGERSFPRERAAAECPAATRFRLLEAFVQTALAVAYAHDRGVVHRDLKPQNVMIGRFGEVHVLDWGLARIAGARPAAASSEDGAAAGSDAGAEAGADDPGAGGGGGGAATGESAIVGTPAYMAPEQADPAHPERRAPAIDVYALGGILFTILTGRPPYRGSATAILAALAEGIPPPPPRALDPTVPLALERVCLRALAHDPALRPPSARALADEVERFLEGRSEAAPRPEDTAFLAAYDPAAYRRPSVSVDVVVLADRPGGARAVLVHRRRQPPALGQLALPGGFFELEEPLEAAAARKLREEAGIDRPVPLVQIGAFGAPGRDPRTRVISVAFLARAPAGLELGAPLKRDIDPRWLLVGPSARGAPAPALALADADGAAVRADEIAFDHLDIIAAALRLADRGSAP